MEKSIVKREIKVQKETLTDKVFFWKGVPVCTTKQLAEFYETSSDTLMKNFNRNSDKFKATNHYFRLQRHQISKFFEATGLLDWSKNVTLLYLWTQKGAARHAKMLTTERAWDVWEELETSYFEKNTRTSWERVSDLLTPELAFQQRSIAHQKSNSNEINAENVYSEVDPAMGRARAVAYNQRNCVALTGRTPSNWREQGRELGLPRIVTRSAKAIARVVEPELACVRSMADRMILDGINEDVSFEVARSATTTFRLLIASGWVDQQVALRMASL